MLPSKLFTSLRGFFLFLLLLLISIDLSAQVVIKERVIIGSGEVTRSDSSRIKKDVINSDPSLPPTWFTETYFSGTYLASFILDAKYQAPPEDSISVTFHDTTITYCPADYINYRRVDINYYLNICAGGDELIPFDAYFSYSKDPELPFRIPNVHKGDTLIFSYEDCTQDGYHGTDVEFAKWDPDTCFGTCGYCGLTALLSCGINLTPMSFTVWQEEDTLISGSSIALDIHPNGNLRYYYPEIDDSLMTIEVDSAQYAKFIYDRGTKIDTLDSPMDSVKYSDATTGKIKFYAMGKQPEKPVPVTICARFMSDSSRVFEDTIVVKGAEILLGETKYYYATEAEDKLTIHETTLPELPAGAVTTDIWGDNPVELLRPDPLRSGKKNGVYWDKKCCTIGGAFAILEDLQTGMIRLIGRYWHKDSIYTVKLKTGNYTPEASLGIEVKKPSSLGTTYRQGLDITNSEQPYSIDSLCIKWGGIYGFPPQYIKAQMRLESVFEGGVFHPAYRYEPWTTEFNLPPNIRNNPLFRVSLSPPSMGTGNGVPDHHNLEYMTYVQEAHSVWYFIQQYSTIESSPAPSGYSLFGSRDANGNLVFSGYDLPKREYKRIRGDVYRESNLNQKNENVEANNIARQRFITYFKDEYRRGSWTGLNNRPAQSRIASSYGPIQIMYITAIHRGYPTGVTDLPENLSINDTFFPLAMTHYIRLLEEQIGTGNANTSNWQQGFENCLNEVFHRWNSTFDYDTDIMRDANNFLPVE